MKISETPEEIKRIRIEYIDRRWKQLYELEKETGQTALQFLFLTNAGGAAATLAFIGSVGATKIGGGVKISLALFVLGIILAGVSRAKQFHFMQMLFKNWKKQVADYLANAKTWDEMIASDEKAVKDSLVDYAIPYASFFCFILGSLIGFITLF